MRGVSWRMPAVATPQGRLWCRLLSCLFNKSFSMNFSLWKQKLRALRAVEMLESGHSQQYIAQQLGFESSSAFNTAFKKILATTPGQYFKNR